MTRSLVAVSLAALLLAAAACKPEGESAPDSASTAEKTTATGLPEGLKKATDTAVKDAQDAAADVAADVEDAAASAQAGAAKAVEQVEDTASTVAKQAEETTASAVSSAESAVAKASEALPDLTAIVKSSFSIDKLKSAVGSLDAGKLKEIATKITEAIQGQEGVVTRLKEEVAGLDVTRALESAQLQSTLDAGKKVLADLKGKLAVVVDQLKAKGVDVAAFTKFLTPE